MILQDRVAVATASGSGIGRAGARVMAREGAHVVVADRSAEGAEETVEPIRAAGGRAEAASTEVTDDDAVGCLIEGTVERHGRIDILHSHAGVQVGGGVEEVAPEGLDLSYQVNQRAHFMLCRATVPHMKSRGSGVILLAFIISMDDLVITYFIAGVGSTTLPLFIFSMLRRGVKPEINAIATLLVLFSLIVASVGLYLRRRR